MAAAAILKITLFAMSAIIAYICTKFDAEAENWVPQPDLPSKFTLVKNPRWRPPPFLNQLNGNNSGIFERIHTKFDTDTENGVPELVLPAKLLFCKIQDGGGRHIENHTFGHKSAIIAYICTEFDT